MVVFNVYYVCLPNDRAAQPKHENHTLSIIFTNPLEGICCLNSTPLTQTDTFVRGAGASTLISDRAMVLEFVT